MTLPPPQTLHSPHRTAATSEAIASGPRLLSRPTCRPPPPARRRSDPGQSAPSRKRPPVAWVASTADAEAASTAAAAASAAAAACNNHRWGWWAGAEPPPPISHPTSRGPTDHLAALSRVLSLAWSRTPRPRACTIHKQRSRRRAVQLVGTQSDTHEQCTNGVQLRHSYRKRAVVLLQRDGGHWKSADAGHRRPADAPHRTSRAAGAARSHRGERATGNSGRGVLPTGGG